jgi:hypothetical protein
MFCGMCGTDFRTLSPKSVESNIPDWFETNMKHLLHTLEAANMARGAGFSSPKVMRLGQKQKNWKQTKQVGRSGINVDETGVREIQIPKKV